MKKIRLLVLILLSFIFIKTEAQNRFKVGLKAGLSTSQVDGDTYGGFNKAGFDGGATLTAKLNPKWNAQFEMLFIQKGSKHAGDPNKGDYSLYIMQLNYIEVPLLLQFKQKKFTFEAGPQFAFLISGKEYDYYGQIEGAAPFKSTEIAGCVGVSYALYKNLGFSWRYSNSILPIRDAFPKSGYYSGGRFWYNSGQRNVVLSFTLTYIFGSAETK